MAVSLPTQFRSVPPEPWGRRLARVRDDVAGLTLDAAAARAGNWRLTTKSSIQRLEDHGEVPTGPRSAGRRELAWILCRLVYEVDPAEFGLSDDDVPPGLANATDGGTRAFNLGYTCTVERLPARHLVAA